MNTEPLLDVQDIQGNILAGFNKDTQILVGLVIEDVPAAKSWLATIHGRISSTHEVLHFNQLYRSIRTRTKMEPRGLVSTGLNIAFSHDGIAKLTTQAQADALPDVAFRIGMPARAVPVLGDPVDAASPYNPGQWKIGGLGNVPDILLIVGSDLTEMAENALSDVLSAKGADMFRIIYREVGTIRRDDPGHEHFGFKDGISQPGVRGLASSRIDDYITPRLIARSDPLSARFSKPGQPLIMPGHFVLGYGTQSPATGAVQTPPRLAFDWFRNGSFLVFRRLRQDVAAFQQFLKEVVRTLSPQLPGLSSEELGAMFVGRWAGGAPIVRSPDKPDKRIETDTALNAFAFANPMPKVVLRKGAVPDAPPPAPGDPLGQVCPHWAHIRKVNPRDDVTDLGDEFDTLTRRLLRRGIPYGPSFPSGATNDDNVDRGLLFLAYQASLEQSFERITSDWANQLKNPAPNGHDPIIGQTNQNGRNRLVSMPVNGREVDLPITREWVFPTGGGYFFAPSLSAIERVLAKDSNSA